MDTLGFTNKQAASKNELDLALAKRDFTTLLVNFQMNIFYLQYGIERIKYGEKSSFNCSRIIALRNSARLAHALLA